MDYYSFTLQKRSNTKTRISVPINGVSTYLYLTFVYNQIGEYWTMTISDSSQQELVSNHPLLTGHKGAQNILRQLGHLGIGSAYVVNLVDDPTTDYPDFDTWLKEFDLWWGSEAG